MKIAIPTAEGVLCPHFGHCQQFAVLEVDPDRKEIINSEMLTPPPHEPGVIPHWLSQIGCHMIISGGMGWRAIDMFQQKGIGVITGAPAQKPEEIALAYLKGELTTGNNTCEEGSMGHGNTGGCKKRQHPHGMQ
jgi:predicted Fe-Mo cluster-binding NifX family protein